VQALLAEAQDTLLAALPPGTLEVEELELRDEARERWLEQLCRWREEGEARCEDRVRGVQRGECTSEVAREAALGFAQMEGKSASELDAMVRALARACARRELRLAQLALRLHQLNGWRRLGYATEGQYAGAAGDVALVVAGAARVGAKLQQLPPRG
jgi:hypothetical protein